MTIKLVLDSDCSSELIRIFFNMRNTALTIITPVIVNYYGDTNMSSYRT